MVKLLAPNQYPPIQFSLTYKPIYDGTPHSERAKNHSRRKWVVHVEAITEIALTSKALLSLAIKAHTNLPLLLVPILQKKMASSEREDIKHAIVRHTTVLQSISKTFLSKILSLNHPLAALNNATLRMTLMAVTTSNGKKLFLSADPMDRVSMFLTLLSTLLRHMTSWNIYLPTSHILMVTKFSLVYP